MPPVDYSAGPVDYDGPDVHLVGEVFLHPIMSTAFNFHLVATEGLILISYILAGGQAWANLLSIE